MLQVTAVLLKSPMEDFEKLAVKLSYAILSHDSLRKICPSGLFQLFLNLETDL